MYQAAEKFESSISRLYHMMWTQDWSCQMHHWIHEIQQILLKWIKNDWLSEDTLMMLNNESSVKICHKTCKIFLNSKKWIKMMSSFYREKQESLTWFLRSCISKHKKKVVSFSLCNSVFLKAFIDFLWNILQHIIILLNDFMIKMSSTNLFNFFILTFQLTLQLYCMFMFVADIAESFMFNNKMMIDFLEWLNDLYEKHSIVKND